MTRQQTRLGAADLLDPSPPATGHNRKGLAMEQQMAEFMTELQNECGMRIARDAVRVFGAKLAVREQIEAQSQRIRVYEQMKAKGGVQ